MSMLPKEKNTSSPWITLAILSSLGIIAMSAETMVLPAIPDFIVDLHISYQDSSWILAVILVTGAVMTPIAGKLSDIYGKKKVLLVILAIYILGLFKRILYYCINMAHLGFYPCTWTFHTLGSGTWYRCGNHNFYWPKAFAVSPEYFLFAWADGTVHINSTWGDYL